MSSSDAVAKAAFVSELDGASGLHGEGDAQDDRLEARRLRAQVALLTQRLADQERVFLATLNAIADGVAIADRQGSITHLNPTASALLATGETGTMMDDWSARYGVFCTDGVTPFPPEELPLARALQGESSDNVQMIFRHPKKPEGTWAEATARPIRTDDGAIVGGIVTFRDISERRRWEGELAAQLIREREKNETLERLRSAITQMSTPILEVWDEVLALPVIGILDSRRSAEMMEQLLQAVEEKQCRFVIIDITGVEVVDSATADRLLKLVNAVEILGARCILTGARGAVAQTLVSIGASLGSLLTLRNLKHGLRECIWSMEDDGRRAAPRMSRGRGAPGGARA